MARPKNLGPEHTWRPRRRRQVAGGLSIPEFCRRERASTASFDALRRRLAAPPVATPSMVREAGACPSRPGSIGIVSNRRRSPASESNRSVEGGAPPSEQAIGGPPSAPTSREPKWDRLPAIRGREFSSSLIRRTVFGSALDLGRAIRPQGRGHPHRSRPRIRCPVLTRRHGIKHFRQPPLGTISQGPGGDCVHAFYIPGPPKPPVPPLLSSLPLYTGCIRFAKTEMHLSGGEDIFLTQALWSEAEKIFGNS